MLLTKCLAEGDISVQQLKKFYSAVRQFYIAAAQYMWKNLPLNDDVLRNAQFVNWNKRRSTTFAEASFFVERYSNILNLSVREIELLHDEFVDYQLMNESDLPDDVRQAATVQLDDDGNAVSFRMDIIWGYLGNLKVNDYPRYKTLSKLAKLILVLPHSNAEEERAFSIIRKNKTCFRGNLDINRTLSAIMTIKKNSSTPCFQYQPSNEVVKSSKKVTWEFNKAHKK